MTSVQRSLWIRRATREMVRRFQSETQNVDVVELMEACALSLPREMLKQGKDMDFAEVPFDKMVAWLIEGMVEDLDETAKWAIAQLTEEEKLAGPQDVQRFLEAIKEVKAIATWLLSEQNVQAA